MRNIYIECVSEKENDSHIVIPNINYSNPNAN